MPRTYLAHAMAHAVSHRPLTAEAWVQSHASPCEICGVQSVIGTTFSLDYVGFPLSVLFHQCFIRTNTFTIDAV
jgi:hypothetical protein